MIVNANVIMHTEWSALRFRNSTITFEVVNNFHTSHFCLCTISYTMCASERDEDISTLHDDTNFLKAYTFGKDISP